MAIALPVGVEDKLVGTGFCAGMRGTTLAVVTALHLVGDGQKFRIAIPPHNGDLSIAQVYPLQSVPAVEARLVLVEPLWDLAILLVSGANISAPVPRYIASPAEVHVGEEVLVVGYPFAALGSFLETVEPCHISAVGNRMLANKVSRYEFIVSHQTYLGSSGAPVIRRSDGAVCGVIRGCLAPPGMISIGNMPLGTDSNVTYATSAHVLPSLIEEAFHLEGRL